MPRPMVLGSVILRNFGLKRLKTSIIGHILPENYAMRHISKKVGFDVNYDQLTEVMLAEMKLDGESERIGVIGER